MQVFIGKEHKPTSGFIYDPGFIDSVIALDNNDTRHKRVIEEIGHGAIYAPDVFIDRFGKPLHLDCLSTTSKILLGVLSLKEVINATELGDNGFYLLCEFNVGSVWFADWSRNFDMLPTPITVNGRTCSDTYEVLTSL